MAKNKDAWEHRSKKMCCLTCMYFSAKGKEFNDGLIKLGRCKRNAPTMKGFPVVFPLIDWCGEHKLTENITQALWDELE